MWKWVRYIPTPGYKNYGGMRNKCDKDQCPLPIDWMDKAFRLHDIALKKARTQLGRIQADKRLGVKLRKGNPKKLGLWGKIYLFGAKIIFRP